MRLDELNRKYQTILALFIYVSMTWITFGVIYAERMRCITIGGDRWSCNDAFINTVLAFFWPIYWFFRTSMAVFS